MWMLKRENQIRTAPTGQFVAYGFRDQSAAVPLCMLMIGCRSLAVAAEADLAELEQLLDPLVRALE
jgi:hypothetical protein